MSDPLDLIRELLALQGDRKTGELTVVVGDVRTRILVAEGKPEYTLRGAMRVAVDQVLAAQAGLPSFEVWRQTQEAGA